MSDWFYQLPVIWMAVVVFTLTYLVTFATWWIASATCSAISSIEKASEFGSAVLKP